MPIKIENDCHLKTKTGFAKKRDAYGELSSSCPDDMRENENVKKTNVVRVCTMTILKRKRASEKVNSARGW